MSFKHQHAVGLLKLISFRENRPHNSGDDLAGIVHSVGKNVSEFKLGDRVGAFHDPGTDNGAYAEYAVAYAFATFHIASNVSFEDAATLPIAGISAAMALFDNMKLPPPYSPSRWEGEKIPLLIYGATTAVGAFAAKFARLSGFSPIIGVAGRASEFAKTLVDYVVDYRVGEDALVTAVEEILATEGLGSKITNVLDAVSENGSFEATARFIEPNGGTVCTVLRPEKFAREKENFKYPGGVTSSYVFGGNAFSTHKDFAFLWTRYLARLLEDGRLTAHPYEVVPGGLNGVLTGLKNLKSGKASAVKYLYRIKETEGL